MKTYIKGLAFIGVAASLAACTDLDVEPKTQYVTVPDNPIIVQSEFQGCYYYTRNEAWFGRNFWEGPLLMGDEMIGCCYTTASYFDNGRWLRCTIHDPAPDTPGIGQMGDLMAGLSYTNQRIQNFGGKEKTDPVVAPLRAVRAYYLFWMMELYGDCPMMDHVPAEGETLDRVPRADIARYIESELLAILDQEDALELVPTTNNYGLPTRGMAEALLVKLYLNWGVYTTPIKEVTANTPNEKLNDCVKWCDQITAEGQYALGKGYRKKFFPDNGPQIKDFIYAIPFDPATLGGNAYYAGHEWNRFVGFKKEGLCKPNTWGWKPDNSLAGNMIMTPEAVGRFNLPGDERNDMVLAGQVYAFDADFNKTDEPVIVYKTATYRKEHGPLVYQTEFEWDDLSILSLGEDSNLDNCMKGARCVKYPPAQESDKDWGRKQSNDIPVFRYADILLTKAECLIKGATATNGDTPASLINQVRDCASAPHITGNVTMQDLMDERTRELIMEPWRRNDLIRNGMFEGDWGAKTNKKDLWRRLLPIPTNVMDTNTNWSQNEGY